MILASVQFSNPVQQNVGDTTLTSSKSEQPKIGTYLSTSTICMAF